MLAKKNKDIKKAYDLLQVISKDEKGITIGIEIGVEKGATANAIKGAENYLRMGLTVEQVAKGSELSVEKVLEIKKKMMN